jgi:DNA replication protein DnaC
LVTRECEDRQRDRIQRLLNQSRIPAEKALSTFALKRLPRFIKRLGAFGGLIIDDLGYVQQSREEMEVLFHTACRTL